MHSSVFFFWKWKVNLWCLETYIWCYVIAGSSCRTEKTNYSWCFVLFSIMQNFLQKSNAKDASGNAVLGDIGVHLQQEVKWWHLHGVLIFLDGPCNCLNIYHCYLRWVIISHYLGKSWYHAIPFFSVSVIFLYLDVIKQWILQVDPSLFFILDPSVLESEERLVLCIKSKGVDLHLKLAVSSIW